MLFNSISFLVFFPLVTALYFLLPPRSRGLFLLLASCYFYMSFVPIYILVLAYTITIDYAAGFRIEKSTGTARKAWLALSLFANIGALCFFKYAPALAKTLPGSPDFLIHLLLPIGLSFHTFQAMSYTLEIYRGRWKAERNFITYSLYVMFFPQLVAGPIERPGNLLPQFGGNHSFQQDRVVEGLRLMLWGLFKKMVIADFLAQLVDLVYDHVRGFSGPALMIATFFFAIQIFCDFSGYTDIARGAARVLGFHLMLNFKNPYGSASFEEFWKRWHISLSSWFRDYFYIPLGGNRAGPGRHYFNLMLTFAVSGIWHGANLTFAVWGLLNGLYVALSHLTREARVRWAAQWGLDRFPRFHQALNTLFVFTLTCFAWIFFRADNLSDAGYILTHLFHADKPLSIQWQTLGWEPLQWAQALLLSALVLGLQWGFKDKSLGAALARQPRWARWGFYYGLTLCVGLAFFFASYSSKRFIYFQF